MLTEDRPDVTAKYRIGDEVYRIGRLERSGVELIVILDADRGQISYPWSRFKMVATKVGSWL